jgi:1-acyl-sn-glycerol-3-phosphate acyltransferase
MAAQVLPFGHHRSEVDLCGAITASGRPCRNRAKANGFCAVHQPPQPGDRIGPFAAEDVRELLDYARRRLTGDFEVDEFGFDDEWVERVVSPGARPLIDLYWRTTWKGLLHVPSTGAALLVGNHAGTIPVDAMVMKLGVLEKHPAHRHVRLLAADLALRMPFVAEMTRRLGSTLACDEDALRLLSRGDLLGVFPEGYKGVGKGWRKRYRLQRFGRGGFVKTALQARVPIVPVAIVGSEEIYPMVGNIKVLARVFGLPYFPVTPTFPWLGPLGAIPLPSKWIVEFGEPIQTDGYPADADQDAMLVFELADRVRDTIQQMLYRNLMERGGTFV